RGFRFIGALGVTIITLIIGALGRWNSSHDIGLLRDPLLLALTLIAAGWALWTGKRDKDASRTWPAAIALGTLALGLPRELSFDSDAAKALIKAGANVLTLTTAVWLVRTGLGEGRLRPYVYGSLVFLAWLTARYVDIAKDFGMLGTAGFFAAIGVILFILARVWRAQKDEAAPAAEPNLDLPWLERVFAAVTSRARAVVLIAALLQCLGLLWMAWNHSRPSEVGQRFVLRCQAVDPRDLLRGEYVTLGYEFSNPNPADIKRLNREWIQLSGADRRDDVESYWLLPEDTMIYVPLKVDAKGLASGGSPTLKRPESGPYLKGYAGSRRFGQIRFGIEAFYVKEGTGNTWEKLRNQGLLVAEIGVLPDGRAGLVGLRKADESMTKAIPFHRLEQHFYSGKDQWVQRYVIRTPEEFQRFLSPARVAGPAPRLPDFSKEIVVLISQNETDRDVRIAVTGVERFGGSLMVRYRVTQGAKTSHKSKPMEAVIIERGDATEVTLLQEPLGDGRGIRLPLR
ncbi:MAG: GDYXXLXY domain-containing protein, partial [Opitutales bacterium]|nr:GDYXXLXY domain-containing protein [Opitutales bacterium]MDP4894267.1 GDYXXLXY domain-containing protein [Opitutales bacterium]